MLAHRSSRGAGGTGLVARHLLPVRALLGRADGDGTVRHLLAARGGSGRGNSRVLAVGSVLARRRICLSGSGASPLRICSAKERHLLELDRADVDAVDAGHRRDVAGAEALEVADVDVGVLGHLVLDRVEQLVAAAQRAGDVRADVDAVAADGLRVELVVERGDRDDVAGREPHDRGDLRDASGEHQPCRRWAAARAGIVADRRSGYLAMWPRSPPAGPPGTRRSPDRGRRRVLGGVDGVVPAGDTRPVREAGDLVAEAHGASGRSRPGWGRASPASR